MEENNMNQSANPAAGQGTGEKTFSQEDVNRIVGDRLAKEKAKATNDVDFSKREQELAQRELRLTAKEVLTEKGIPVQLLDALNCTDKETLDKSISVIEKVFKDYKAEATKQIKFQGFSPAASIRPTSNDAPTEGDLEIRKAMGLR